MKILVICQYYYPEQFRVNDICETLVKKGNEVTVLTGLPNYPVGKIPKEYKFFRKRKEIINGVNVIRSFEIGRRKGFIFRILNYISYPISASFKTLFLKKDFDVIYVYQLSPVLMAIPGIVYKKRSNKKMILYCLDLWPDSMKAFGVKEQSKIYKLFSKISKKIYSKADKILVTSKMFINEIENNKIEYLPQYSDSLFEKKSYIENGKTDIVFAGNIGKAQSIDTIIKAANELNDYDNIIFHIVGEGSALEENKQLASKLELKNVIFYGKRKIEEMQEFYNLADAMLVTLSKDEFASKTLPGKVQSCMATACPIIASADGETQQIIKEANCGFSVSSENHIELANTIKKFDSLNILQKRQLGENGYNYYNNNFKKEKIIKQIVKILEEVRSENSGK